MTRSVMICTPSIRQPTWHYTQGLMDTAGFAAVNGIALHYRLLERLSMISRARNCLAAAFLLSDCEEMVFIDDDIGWTVDGFRALLSHPCDVVAGVARKDDFGRGDRQRSSGLTDWCFEPLQGRSKFDGRLLQVSRVGTGFMRITRRVFERLRAAHPERATVPSGSASAPDGGRYFPFFDDSVVSEDYAFCDDWRAIGGEVCVDVTIKLEHESRRTVTGDLGAEIQDWMRSGGVKRSDLLEPTG